MLRRVQAWFERCSQSKHVARSCMRRAQKSVGVWSCYVSFMIVHCDMSGRKQMRVSHKRDGFSSHARCHGGSCSWAAPECYIKRKGELSLEHLAVQTQVSGWVMLSSLCCHLRSYSPPKRQIWQARLSFKRFFMIPFKLHPDRAFRYWISLLLSRAPSKLTRLVA